MKFFLRYVSALLALNVFAQSGDASVFAVAIVCHGSATELPNHPIVNLEIAGPVKFGQAQPTHVRIDIPDTGFSATYPTAPITITGTKLSSLVVQGQPLPEGTLSTPARMTDTYLKFAFELSFSDANTGSGGLNFTSQRFFLKSTKGPENFYETRSESFKIPNLKCWKI